MQEQFANNAISIITAALSPTDVMVHVQNPVPFPTVGQFRLLVDNELMLCTSVSGPVFTVTRGVEDTVATSHANYSPIILPITAGSLNNITGSGGSSGAILTTGFPGFIEEPSPLVTGDTTNPGLVFDALGQCILIGTPTPSEIVYDALGQVILTA